MFLEKKTLKLQEEAKARMDKKVLKSLPSYISTKEIPEMSYYPNNYATNVGFKYKDCLVTVSNVNTWDPKQKEHLEKIEKNNKDAFPSSEAYRKICQDITNLQGGNKRIKSKMLKTFLTKTDEGKAILGVLGEKPNTLLQIEDKPKKK